MAPAGNGQSGGETEGDAGVHTAQQGQGHVEPVQLSSWDKMLSETQAAGTAFCLPVLFLRNEMKLADVTGGACAAGQGRGVYHPGRRRALSPRHTVFGETESPPAGADGTDWPVPAQKARKVRAGPFRPRAIEHASSGAQLLVSAVSPGPTPV